MQVLNSTQDAYEIDKLLKWIENQATSIMNQDPLASLQSADGMALGSLFGSMDRVVSIVLGSLNDLTLSFDMPNLKPLLNFPHLGELMGDLKGSVMALAEAAQEEVAETLENLMGEATEAAGDIRDELEAQLGPLGDIGRELMNVSKQFTADRSARNEKWRVRERALYNLMLIAAELKKDSCACKTVHSETLKKSVELVQQTITHRVAAESDNSVKKTLGAPQFVLAVSAAVSDE